MVHPEELKERFKWLKREIKRLLELEQTPIVVDGIRMYTIQAEQILKVLEGDK